ncbi:MAG: Gfo/Idh/MocA family oxidoreductase [Chthoniobacter sp.]|uniref:Gfo/Idh/MocA family protein n=1 Tax=Chthoniobacter sp. TaxID=2510640 RepID=UPI0032AC983D
MSAPLEVAIVGCGLIGRKRAQSLAGARLTLACDLDAQRAQELATLHPGSRAVTDLAEVLRSPVQLVIVATANHALAPLALEAIRAGKHVLIEKPGAISTAELETLIAAAEAQKVQVRIGYNHRYHPALRKARELIDAGAIGDLMFLRGRYGHGGRLGYEKEWRSDPQLSGGGELIDQGVHLIDLAQWFLGGFTDISGHAATFFWDMPVDDNAFLSLRTARGQTAWLHVSCTEWKNLFSLEIYGRTGKLHIEGLGGSYGVERLAFYKMLPQMGPPDTTIFEYSRGDDSWRLEMAEFLEDIRLSRTPQPGLREGLATLRVVESIYRSTP